MLEVGGGGGGVFTYQGGYTQAHDHAGKRTNTEDKPDHGLLRTHIYGL